MEWQPTDTVPADGFFLVYDRGAMRTMLRENGRWRCTAVALDENGYISDRIQVRETGVHEPTHWMELPEPPR
jgi:hypothetical protein